MKDLWAQLGTGHSQVGSCTEVRVEKRTVEEFTLPDPKETRQS